LEAFAVPDPERRTPAVWRFDRITGESKLVGVGDAEVVKDIYTVFGEDGTPDTGIEDEIFCDVEGAFCSTRNLLRERAPLVREHWTGLARFIAAQLLRTPRILGLLREANVSSGVPGPPDTPTRAMVVLIDRYIIRIARMNGMIVYNETNLPLLTCDNPAVTWKKKSEGFQTGVAQHDPDLVISCPLAPDLMFIAYQTPESLEAVLAERLDADLPPKDFNVHVDRETLSTPQVERLNLICGANAHRYVYSSDDDGRIRQFLTSTFFAKQPPTRNS